EVLQRHRDASGRNPVMSLALVLAVPDGPAIEREGRYCAVALDDARFAPVLGALHAGAAGGVFALQLHGLEHYWPPALMASTDAAVQRWLRGPVPAATEQLPSPLQSRWTDAGALPSGALPAAQIRAAVATEVEAYTRIVGAPPRLVVPPTFVWTREVEAAWAAAGVQGIVTPGWRYPQRDAQGLPAGDEGPIVNGQRSGELCYVVRTDYFEPTRGRGAQHALGVFARMAAQGRPCVLENHRDNFIQGTQACEASLRELEALVTGALAQAPAVRFMSTRELERILRARDPQWIVHAWRVRLPFAWQRLRASGRLWKLLRLSGLAAVGSVLVRWAARPAS
ncbi:MAG TPA: hypothetical protein PLT38_09835, partial [Rubrivivax sp.]|nr:hypothetical protein [Rubrivivax sp.]